MLSDADLLFSPDDLPDDPVRVVLGDDNALYRRGLLTALEDEADLEVVAEAGPGADLIAAVRALAPDVVVCSLSMPGVGGVETTFALTEVMPLVRVAVLTTDQDPVARVVAAVGAGAYGQADKVEALEAAPRVIRGLHRGWPVLSEQTWAGVAAAAPAWLAPDDTVSAVEARVLAALSGGGSWEAAAETAGTSPTAARNQVRNLLARVRAVGTGDARQAAVEAGLLSLA